MRYTLAAMLLPIPLTAALTGCAGSFSMSDAGEPPSCHLHSAAAHDGGDSRFIVPSSLREDHDLLHEKLAKALAAGGRTGQAAREVQAVLHPHFLKEDAVAMPPLGLLGELAAGRFDASMAEVLELTDRLERDLPTMLAEHKQIVAALSTLAREAESEGKPEIATIANQIRVHAQMEEQVLYPAALLVGRYVRMQLAVQ
jgi:hypothetical protein